MSSSDELTLPDDIAAELDAVTLEASADAPEAEDESDEGVGKGRPESKIERPKANFKGKLWLVDPVNHPSLFSKPAPEGMTPDVTDAVVAASVAMGILSVAKKASWADLDGGVIPEELHLTSNPDSYADGGDGSNQLRSLTNAAWVLSLVRNSLTKTQNPAGVSVKASKFIICTSCGRWMVAGSAVASKKCPFTERCTGSPYTVAPAIPSIQFPAAYSIQG